MRRKAKFDLRTFSGVVTERIVVVVVGFNVSSDCVVTLVNCSGDLSDDRRLSDSTEKRRSFEETLFLRSTFGDREDSVALLELFIGEGIIVD